MERAVERHRVVVLRYRDGAGRPSRREVEPHLLARTHDHWFLVAWCRERRAPRWFRSDRIEAVELTSETAPRRDLADVGVPPSPAHPAGRSLRRRPPAAGPASPPTADTAPDPVARPGRDRPRLVALPGGRS
nr:WYL domain-containing protein [Geodermatophilus sabuli]